MRNLFASFASMALFVGALGFAACSDDDNTSTDPGEGGGILSRRYPSS
ncbi:hypothetical protein [Alistipes communis]|nr:hypothetical protein [Alistipes communis]